MPILVYCPDEGGWYTAIREKQRLARVARSRPSRFLCRCRTACRALRPCRFLRCSGAARRSLCLCGLLGRGGAFGGGAARGGTLGVLRESPTRNRAPRFALQDARDRTRDARLAAGLALALSRFISVLGTLASALLGLALLRWRKVDA